MEAAPSTSSSASSDGCALENAAVSTCDQEERMESWLSRLRAFYWAHDPRKVDRVDEILARHEGKEELFLQQVHREFGVRDFSGEEAIDDIYEHQRYSYLSFSWGSSYPGHLLPTDRHQWSGQHGSPSSQNRQKVEPQLPVNWCWTSDWTVDKTSCKCDSDGWVYALDFTMINYSINKGQERSEPNATDYVRRRRWIRMRRRVHTDFPAIETPERGNQDNSAALCSGDEISKEITWVIEGGEEREKAVPGDEFTDISESVKQIIADHVEHDVTSDIDRPGSPVSPKTQPVPIKRIELEHFPVDIEKSGFDAAWKEAVMDLEQVYTFAKDNQAKKKQKWSVKKEKIKRQIHLLENTIVSMQTIAMEKVEKRQSGRSKFQSSPRHSMRSTPSPTNKSMPSNASMDSPTNAINLASRMQCAQSKLDALRRFYWHPRENNYTLRFSIDGIFYGLRDFFVESFNSSFSIQISHQTNGAQGITPTCKVTMKGHTVCCGKHVKVVGEKGTRIPKSIWDSMYMDSDFEVSICLIYVEDVDEPGSMAQGSWEFLLSPEATRVELINFTRRVKGGMDLPEPMVRKLCSDVLTSLVRDLTLLYFPYELALAFNLPPAKLDIKGELQITGQPIDDVMEKELKELDLGAIREAEAKQKLRRQATATEKNLDELQTPLSPILGAAANAALMFSSLLSGSDKKMQAIAKLLELSSAQFNLLVALKNCRLFPSTHNFHSLASICAYFNAFSIDEEGVESKDNERRGQEEKLRATWKRILELIYIQRMQTTGVKSTTPMTPKATRPESEEAKTAAQVELFDMDKFFDLIKRLSKKPASVQVSVKHFYCTLNALNVVEALSKLYERVILGIDYRKPRTGADGFIYGIRLGRKASQQPAMAMAAAAVAASAAANADDELYPVGSPPVLDLRRYRPAEISFRTRVQTFSKFWQSLKKVIEFVRENIDDVSVELAGNLKGTCDDCVLNGSFKDAEFRGPLSMGLAIPPCFLGFYRAEVISLGNDRVGMQVDAMLPSTSKTVGNDVKQQSTKTLESIGRAMLADLTSEVVIDLDALIAHEQHRREKASAAKKAPATLKSPTQGRPPPIVVGSPKQRGAGSSKALVSPTSTQSPEQSALSPESTGSPKQNTAPVGVGAPKKSRQHCALAFSFGPTSRDAENNHVAKTGSSGQLNVSTSEFTKLHTTAKAGSFMFRVLSLVDWVFTTYVRPQMLRAFPQHQMLFDAAQVTLMQLLRSAKLEMNFDVMARAFIHEDESLMVTLCGSPLHPMPLMYRDEVNLLDIILQVDDLTNIWIDDRYPPYSNPLYF